MWKRFEDLAKLVLENIEDSPEIVVGNEIPFQEIDMDAIVIGKDHFINHREEVQEENKQTLH